jgi:integrase
MPRRRRQRGRRPPRPPAAAPLPPIPNPNNTHLLTASYAPRTAHAYKSAAQRFIQWLAEEPTRTPATSAALDQLMSDYMHQLYRAGKGKALAIRTFYGLDMFIPGIKDQLPLARRSMRGYMRSAPSTSYPPMPWTVVVAMAMWFAGKGQLRLSIAVMLSFDCYLRSGELLSLTTTDIAFGDDHRIGSAVPDSERVLLHLRHTKTGAHKGVVIRSNDVKLLLRVIHSTTPPGQHLFPFTRPQHLRWFRRCITALQLPSHYVPHSLRHGGATHDYMAGMPLADVMVRGRWAVAGSAQHSIQQCRQLLLLQSIPPSVHAMARAAEGNMLVSLFEALRRAR